MTRFITGDELGHIKVLRYGAGDADGENKTESKIVRNAAVPNSVQRLAVASGSGEARLVAAAHADGSASAFSLQANDDLEVLHEWKETRLKTEQRYVGLHISEKSVYSCTSNGALRLTTLPTEGVEPVEPRIASLPTRLCDWRLASDQQTFAYGGDEVDLSVWDTERAFLPRPKEDSTTSSAAKKRKRSEALFPGEVWRARNVPNDFLGLRQPIRITSLTYISPSSEASQHHLLAGTQLGDLRRYDTRAARRPVCDWKGLGKVGGIKVVEKGLSEHEAFISDHGCNLFSVDLRVGRVVYGYQGLSGAVTSIAPSPSLLASTALDRFARIHSTFPPPTTAGQRQDNKGQVLDKVFTKSIPTVVVWDQDFESTTATSTQSAEDAGEDADDIWNELEDVDDDASDDETNVKKRRRNKAT